MPAAVAVSDSAAVASRGVPQAPPAVVPFTGSTPDEGVTLTPAGSAARLQSTLIAPAAAGAAPRWIVAGCPWVTVIPPLGTEKPTAGAEPDSYDGGLEAGEDAQAESGVPERE